MLRRKITIIGAGIGGVCTALELANRGYKVCLLEATKDLLSRTSDITPGRLGLGFHYPVDKSLLTAIDVIKGALAFKKRFPTMLIKNEKNSKNLTHGWYFLTKNSYISTEEFISYCENIRTIYKNLSNAHRVNSGDSEEFFRFLDTQEFVNLVCQEKIEIGIETKEELIDWPKLKLYLLDKIVNNPNVEILSNRLVVGIDASEGPFLITVQYGSGFEKIKSQIVVNATCEHRLKIDKMVGYVPKESWSNRLKLIAGVSLPKQLRNAHSIFFTQGPFAMFTNIGNGLGFLTHAPTTNMGSVDGSDIPDYWEKIICHGLDPVTQKVIGWGIIDGVSQYIPMMREVKLRFVKAGVVHHTGAGNIYDPASGIHHRTDTGFFRIKERYYSFNVGKLVFAPMHAESLANEIIKMDLN